MHYTGTIWRPPYEAGSLLIQVTAGCTHHRCKFCTLYEDLPFSFRLSPLEEVRADLEEARAQLQAWGGRPVRRVFLVGANPFVLRARRLEEIAEAVHQAFPSCQTIGCFSRVTDVAAKTQQELEQLHRLGYDGLTLGVETGDDQALAFMDKGYDAQEILTQTRRLDGAGIRYNFFYLAGISGKGRGILGAEKSAAVFNQTHPQIIGSSMLTVFPEAALSQEIRRGTWQEESELEKLEEVKTLVEQLTIPVWFAMLGASNAVYVQGNLPEDRGRMVAALEGTSRPEYAGVLEEYRRKLQHL